MNSLKIVKNDKTDPFENLSVEKNLLELELHDDVVLMLWQNECCVVVGRFQNPCYEVNLDYVRAKRIPVVRRFTGGGTVYHDLGNLNITLCKEKDNIVFSHYILDEARAIANILAETVRKLTNAPVVVDDRASIFIEGRKISGSSTAIRAHKFFYHSTLLVNSDLQALKECLKWEETYPEDQRDFVKSKRSQVANLSEYMPSITLDTVKKAIICEFVHTLAPKDVIFLG
ncbi:MAG TPA: hypothetical protein DCR68_04400 [Coprothermobacter sp.]|jgi:lipoate-protein ligase A|nr:hypothetical protein [Coprothermobacter sp.]